MVPRKIALTITTTDIETPTISKLRARRGKFCDSHLARIEVAPQAHGWSAPRGPCHRPRGPVREGHAPARCPRGGLEEGFRRADTMNP
jgi:hypothetical protein